MNLPLGHFALGPVVSRSVDRAEQTNAEERTAWQQGVVSAAALVDNNRSPYGLLSALAGTLIGVFAVPGPWYVRVLLGFVVLWLVVPTLVASAFALYAPYVQRDEARESIRGLRLKHENDLAAAKRERDQRVKAERDAFEAKWAETEDLRGQLGEAEMKIQGLEAELREARLPAGARLARAAANTNEVLRTKLDEFIGRGFDLYGELDTGPEPTETDEEGRGIAFPLWPPDSKWERAYEFDREARELLRRHDPALLFAYADGVNAAQRKRRRREKQRNEAQKRLPPAEQMSYMVDRLHRRPAEDVECYTNALADVRKQL